MNWQKMFPIMYNSLEEAGDEHLQRAPPVISIE